MYLVFFNLIITIGTSTICRIIPGIDEMSEEMVTTPAGKLNSGAIK